MTEARKGTLLIVDDEPHLRELLAEMLAPHADEIVMAENGKEALAIVMSGAVDAVLTDINMPVMTGLNLLAELRRQFMQIPVVILTGYGDKNSILEALRLNATDFLEKPFGETAVISAIEKALFNGVLLKEMEAIVDQEYENSTLTAEELVKHKRQKKITLGLKLGISSSLKKAA
jgi:YesN/AraC family two-component response regulator